MKLPTHCMKRGEKNRLLNMKLPTHCMKRGEKAKSSSNRDSILRTTANWDKHSFQMYTYLHVLTVSHLP